MHEEQHARMLIVRPPSDHLTISSSCLTCSLLKLILCCLPRAYNSNVCPLLGSNYPVWSVSMTISRAVVQPNSGAWQAPQWLACELETFVAAQDALYRAQGGQGKMLCLTLDATCFMPGKACPPTPTYSRLNLPAFPHRCRLEKGEADCCLRIRCDLTDLQ